jgi:macrolide transport system ATP-binding/permease protein
MWIERWRYTLPLRLKSIFRGGQAERELDDELRFHLEHKLEEGIANGMSADQARLAAWRAMDGLDQRKEQMRDARRIHWLTDFVDDTRYAIRSLFRTPGLTAFVVVTLALGIGMSTASFSMVDGLILRPYPVPNPGNIVDLVSTTRDNGFDDFSYRELLDIRASARSYDAVVANTNLQGVGFTADPASTPRVKAGMLVSGNFFRGLGVEPQLGRAFRDDEDAVAGRDAVVVLGPDFWKHEFGSDRSIVGRAVRLNGADFTVIGVAPESFPGLLIFQRPDFYVPLSMARLFATDRQKSFFEDRDDRELTLRGRLKAKTTQQQARSEMAVIAQDFQREYPSLNRDRGATVRTLFEVRTHDDGGGEWRFIVIFAVLALVVLLVACTNVAGLLLSRAQTRTREIALRLALGAGRFRLVRMLLAESAMLACLGGLGGIAVAFGAVQFFRTLSIPSELPVILPFQLDSRAMLASLVLSILSAFACGLVPALQSTRTDVVTGLKAADVDLATRRKRLGARNMLVVAQVSLSLVLLTASLLMMRGFRIGLDAGTGSVRNRVLMAQFDPRLVRYSPAQTQQFYKVLAERIREVPGVESAALTQNPPLGLGAFDRIAFVPDGYVMPRDRENFTATLDTVDEGFFTTMGVPMVQGRAFTRSDTADSPRVAVVNEQFAKHYWPNGDALGQHLRLDHHNGASVEIVGVAKTVKYRSTFEKPTDFVYVPLNQRPGPRMVLLMRSAGDPHLIIDPLTEVVRALDTNMPVSNLRTYEDVYRYNTVEGPGIGVEIVGAMGVIGLMLAVAGLYGLVAYTVSRRTREIGIRMAIGASPGDVLRLVIGQGLALVGIGTAIGAVMGLGLERVLNAFLFNAGGVDVIVYAIVVPSLLIVTTLAAYVPARRAARIAPTQALRYE